MVTAEDIRRAASRLRAQNDGTGPLLSFSFGDESQVTIGFNEEREIAEVCIDALVDELNAPPVRTLSLAEG
jgi:hypothetical protein